MEVWFWFHIISYFQLGFFSDVFYFETAFSIYVFGRFRRIFTLLTSVLRRVFKFGNPWKNPRGNCGLVPSFPSREALSGWAVEPFSAQPVLRLWWRLFLGFVRGRWQQAVIFWRKNKRKQRSRNGVPLVVSFFFIGVGSSSTLFSRKSSVDFCFRDAVGKPKGYVQEKLAKPDTFATRMSQEVRIKGSVGVSPSIPLFFTIPVYPIYYTQTCKRDILGNVVKKNLAAGSSFTTVQDSWAKKQLYITWGYIWAHDLL